ncbi:MAG: NAD-dependent epimerase/dehydratase family protein [Pseudomonadota bacterium]
MKILLTGATGFLGSHLAKHFIALGHEVVGLRRPTSSMHRLTALENKISWHLIDELWASTDKILAGVDAIVHTAASYGRNNESLAEVINTNIAFPLRLLDVASASGIDAFINTDSALPRAFNAYSLSKAQFADWGKHFTERNGTTFINFLLDHMYGPGDDPTKFSDYVIEACLNNQPELRLTPGEQKRDFIFIDDVIAAYDAVLGCIGNGLHGYHDIPLGSGHAISIREFVDTVHELAGSSAQLCYGAIPYRANEIMLSVADTRKLQALGWTCHYSLEAGLTKTIRSKR